MSYCGCWVLVGSRAVDRSHRAAGLGVCLAGKRHKHEQVWLNLLYCASLRPNRANSSPRPFFLATRRCSPSAISAVSFSLKCRKHFDVNMNIESPIIFGDTVDAFKATFAVWTRSPSKGRSNATNHGYVASRETGDGLTGTHSAGSLDRTKTVPKWPREHRARASLREASRRDKAMRSWSLYHCTKLVVGFF